MIRVVATVLTLCLGASPALACPPVPVVPGAGLLQQQSFMQSYSSVGAAPGLATVPTAGCDYGAAGASFAPSFAPAFAPAYAPVGYGTTGVVPVGVGGGLNVNVFGRGRGIFPGHHHHGGVHVHGRF